MIIKSFLSKNINRKRAAITCEVRTGLLTNINTGLLTNTNTGLLTNTNKIQV
jgi:hypothetical protein